MGAPQVLAFTPKPSGLKLQLVLWLSSAVDGCVAHDGHGHIAIRCWRLIIVLIVAAAASGGGSGHHRVGHVLAAAYAFAHSSPAVCVCAHSGTGRDHGRPTARL